MYDVLIIGGGPAGLTSAVYLRRAEKSVLLIEKETFGGQITHSPRVENYPGFVTASGNEIADKFLEQAMSQGADIELDEIKGIEKKDASFILKGERGEYEGKSVIIATGSRHRKLGLENEEQMAPLAAKIVEKGLSVRDVERTVRLMNYTPDPVDTEEASEAKQRKAYMHDLEHRAVSVLGRRVRILKTSKKKVVELAYSDDDDLEALLKSICGGDFFADND